MLIILGNAGLWCTATTDAETTIPQEPNHQEVTDCSLPIQETATPISAMPVETSSIPVLSPSDAKTESSNPKPDDEVMGTVRDLNGEPLIGANITVVGTTRGTITDIDGRYRIRAKHGDIIRVSFIGFRPMEATVNSDILDIILNVPVYQGSGKRKYLGSHQLFYEIELATDHIWLASTIYALEHVANAAIFKHNQENYSSWPSLFSWTWTFLNPPLKENGEKVTSFKIFGFKLKDMMHYLRTGGKIGWAGGLNSCFGVYGRFYFEHQRHFMRLQHEDSHEYSWTNAIMPGIGVRFTPQFWTGGDQVNPYFEVGTTYTHILGCKSRYGKDKDQFGHGLVYTFGVGVRGNGQFRNSKIFIGLELPQYDFFNRKWSSDGGFYFPYANIRDRRWRMTLNISVPLPYKINRYISYAL